MESPPAGTTQKAGGTRAAHGRGAFLDSVKGDLRIDETLPVRGVSAPRRPELPRRCQPNECMPKLVVEVHSFPATRAGAEPVYVLAFDGFVDRGNCRIFERQLEVSEREHRYVVLDFRDVRYINSAAIAVLIRSFEQLRAAGGVLCLANVSREVGLAMHLLGVTSLVSFQKDVAHARQYLDTLQGSIPGKHVTTDERIFSESSSDLEQPTPPAPTLVPLRRRGPSDLNLARVLVVMPERGRFTRVLRLRFKELKGDYRLVHTVRQARQECDGMEPDLVVVHYRCDPHGDFVQHVKTREEGVLTSVVKLYRDAQELANKPDFKIWENDYLVEPFELLELFTLIEAELERLHKDRKVLRKQLHMEFRSNRESVEKAYKLTDFVLRQVLTVRDDSTALYAAVKEAIENAIVHGNRQDEAKRVQLHVLVGQRKITIIVEDEGDGFDFEYHVSRLEDHETFERAKRRIVEENGRAGLGILLMSRCVDRLEYAERGNVLRLERNL